MDVAYRFRKNCERSDAILKSFVDSTLETLTDENSEQENDPLSTTKDSRVLVSSEAGDLYEYRPPVGLNVKLVKGAERVTRSMRQKASTTSKLNTQSDTEIIIKTENPSDGISNDDGSECVDDLYYTDMNYDDSVASNRRSTQQESDGKDDNESDSKIMQIKPVRTNKVRLGYTAAGRNKTNVGNSIVVRNEKGSHVSKENTSAGRPTKTKTNAKGEPKPPKKCEICGNTYNYQHALER